MVVVLDKTEELSIDARDRVDEFKRRMLLWDNPVEFVNNMYASHPGPGELPVDYFEEVFGE